MSKERTQRGFRVFGYTDCRAPVGPSGSIRLTESSLAFEGAHAMLNVVEPGHCKNVTVLLNVAQAKMLAIMLQEFIEEAVADQLTEPASLPCETPS